jgi:acetyl esterase/lipase
MAGGCCVIDQSPIPRRRRRLLRAVVAGGLALALAPLHPVSAQTAIPPEAVRIGELCADVGDDAPFPDITPTSDFAEEIACLASTGITRGRADGTYGAHGSVTRAQMASFVARMIDAAVDLQTDDADLQALPAPGDSGFTDVAGTGDHGPAIERLAAAGIVQGGPGGAPPTTYGPDLRVSRAQMASFLNRGIGHLGGDATTGRLPCPTSWFDDVEGDPAVPAETRCDINALAEVGIVQGTGGTVYDPGGIVHRGQMAAFLTRTLAAVHADGLIDRVPAADGPTPAGRYLDEVFDDVTVTRDLQYGAAPDEDGMVEDLFLDMYQPEGDALERRPAIVWVHGGSFRAGNRGLEAGNATTFARRGYVTVSISYRLRDDDIGQAMIDAQHDAQAAVRWLRRHADQYGIDPDRISIGGTSAGAITAIFVANNPEDPGTSGNPGERSDVAAAVSISGFGRYYSPGDPPVVMFHGTADPVLPYPLAVSTCDEIRRQGNVCELHTYEGAGHILYVDHREEIQDTIAEFLHRHLF